MNSGFKVRFF